MERQLPEYTIEGTVFEVDVKLQVLREVADPENTIHFAEMEDHATHYTLNYDPEERNLPGFLEPYITVDIPPMKELDPEGMAEHFGYKLEELSNKTDFDIIVDQQALAIRESGRQPLIEFIPGHEYYVAMHWGRLEPTDLLYNPIRLSDIDYCYIDELNKYWITYDPQTRQAVDPDTRRLVEIPKDLIVLEIPGDGQLDPVGYARKHRLDQNQILRTYPIEMKMKARVVPWSETTLDLLIAQNIKKLSGGLTNAVINGTLYNAEPDSQSLINPIDPDKMIDLKKMDMNPEGTEYICFFDTSKNMVVHPDDQNRQSHDLVMLVIPDPFHCARKGQTITVKEVPTLSNATRNRKQPENEYRTMKQQHRKGKKL